jgi:hypothetical protein
MDRSNIIGVWKLVKYITTDRTSQNITYTYGENAIGYLIYTSDYVSVQIMRSERPYYQPNLPPAFKDRIETAENYGGYVGRYEIHGNTITHFPIVCGFVEYLNTPQKREFKLSENQLTLSHPVYDANRHLVGIDTLIWEKSDSS